MSRTRKPRGYGHGRFMVFRTDIPTAMKHRHDALNRLWSINGGRHDETTPEYMALRAAVYGRAGSACEMCRSRQSLHMHRRRAMLTKRADGGYRRRPSDELASPQIFVLLCAPCHAWIHGRKHHEPVDPAHHAHTWAGLSGDQMTSGSYRFSGFDICFTE